MYFFEISKFAVSVEPDKDHHIVASLHKTRIFKSKKITDVAIKLHDILNNNKGKILYIKNNNREITIIYTYPNITCQGNIRPESSDEFSKEEMEEVSLVVKILSELLK